MSVTVPYRRDTVTWTGYSLIGVWAFFLYFIGPATAAIGVDLDLTEAATGLIGTALAVGLIASSAVGPRAIRRWGRARTLLLALSAMSGAAVLLAVGRSYLFVLVCVALLGMLGATVANTATATLSDLHPRHRARAITEGNATASWLGVVAPAVLGFSLTLPPGWRGAAVVVAVFPLLMLLPVRRVLGSASVRAPTVVRGASAPGTVPWLFWPALVAVGMAVALEFTVNFWAAALIGERTSVDLAAAATALSAMTLGMALGRTFAGGLPNRYPVAVLLVGAFLLAGLGLGALLWAPDFWLSVAGLFLTGLGLSVLFPFAQAQAVSLALDNTDRAVGLTAIAVGLAIGGAPFLLGILANAFGLEQAFGVGFAMVAAGIAATLVVAFLQRRATAGPRRRG